MSAKLYFNIGDKIEVGSITGTVKAINENIFYFIQWDNHAFNWLHIDVIALMLTPKQ